MRITYSNNLVDLIFGRLLLTLLDKKVALVLFSVYFLYIYFSHCPRENNWEFKLLYDVFFSTMYSLCLLVLNIPFIGVYIIGYTLVQNKRGQTGRHILELKEIGIREQTDVNETLTYWNKCMKLKKIFFLHFIHIGDGSAYIINKNRISEGDLELFCKKFESYLNYKTMSPNRTSNLV